MGKNSDMSTPEQSLPPNFQSRVLAPRCSISPRIVQNLVARAVFTVADELVLGSDDNTTVPTPRPAFGTPSPPPFVFFVVARRPTSTAYATYAPLDVPSTQFARGEPSHTLPWRLITARSLDCV